MSVFTVIDSPRCNELVEQSLKGDTEALPMLAEAIYDSLRSYVFRITLSETLTDDIVQETILEMYKIFGQLRKSDRFWPWICKIALNKVRVNSTKNTRRKNLLEKHAVSLSTKPKNIEGLAHVINKEIKQAVLDAMSILSYQQKAVLSMRCYQDMPYSQIAEIMGVSELNSRLLFHRGKKRLQKQLFKYGFGKQTLLPALIIFGKITAPNEAAAAQISINSSVLGVGTVAATVATITTKTALTLSAGSLITLGLVTNASLNHAGDAQQLPSNQTKVLTYETPVTSEHTSIEGHYYYPAGSNGPVMMRLSISTEDGSRKVLLNDNGNYFFDEMGQNVSLQNYNYWKPDLSVMILPTDTPKMALALDSVPNKQPNFNRDLSTTSNLLIATSKHKETNRITFSIENYYALAEERFQYNWPAESNIIDKRDALHQQGWCYFTIDGTFKGRSINGIGQLPFDYSRTSDKPGWLTLEIDSKTEFQSQAGNYLTGLNNPWMGLHCIDSVRRDAAKNDIAFKTQMLSDDNLCEISLLLEKGTIEYTIDLYKDLIEKISFLDESGNPSGQITFEYSTTIPDGYENFRIPASKKQTAPRIQKSIHWLAELISGNL